MKNKHDVTVLKIEACNFEDILFDDKSIIVECTLELDSEYITKTMIDNDCTDYSFINIDIAHRVCEALKISFLKLNKSREVKNYVSKWFGFQIKSIDLIPIFDCESNRIDCQEIKSLIFRFDSISFDLKSIEIEISKKKN
jgi:hypothetical protein